MVAWGIGLMLMAQSRDSVRGEPPGAWIDRIVEARAAVSGVALGRITSDGEFLRRVTLDLAGVVPDPEEARAFVADAAPDKRLRLVDRLLASEEGDVRLARLLLTETTRERASYVWFASLYEYFKWLREALSAGKGWDSIAREILTARGQLDENGAVNFTLLHRVRPDHLTTAVAREFLGSSLGCAQCHDHPRGLWKREQFWGVAAFFARTQAYIVTNGDYGVTDTRFGRLAMPPLEHPDIVRLAGDVDPETPALTARWIDGRAAEGEEHLRAQLAAFVVRDRLFPLNFANRQWAWLLGRGVVEPRDELDAAQPVPELLAALSEFLVAHAYEPRALLREIAASRTYQRESVGPPADDALFTRASLRPLDIDQLFATLQRVTGQEAPRVPSDALPERAPSRAALPSIVPYIKIITPDAGAMHVLDEPERHALLSMSIVDHFVPDLLGGEPGTLRHELGRQNGMKNSLVSAAERAIDRCGAEVGPAHVEWIWWSLLTRAPTAEELAWTRELLASSSAPRDGLTDVVWAVWNSHEFSHNH